MLGDAPVEIERRKALALLAYLAVTRQSHTRPALAALLWPEAEPGRASANLRQALWDVNQAAGEGWVIADREAVSLNSESDVWLDVAEFQSVLAVSRASDKGCVALMREVGQAVALYENDFLAGFSLKDAPGFDEWAFFQAEGLRRDLTAALERLVRCQCESGAAEAAIPNARRWLSLDPLNEAAHRALMQVYEQADQHNAALRQYQECARILHDELGAEPQPETTALYEKIRAGEGRTAKPSRPPAPRHNLPAQLTSFIGREKELAEIERLISTHRLVTLAGPGGTGKTRLSLQAAGRILASFPQGVWLVELAPLADPAHVPAAIAAALGLREEAGRPALTILTDFLRAKKILIVLDNCEHLVEECAQLAETLLSQCAELRLLASSREALGVSGEVPFRVPSLSTPDVRQLPAIEVLTKYEAVRLFVERATTIQPGFALTNDNGPAIARLCHRLDGIPLAVELAAARVTMLRVEQIAARLDDRFRLLTGGSRTALPRHQTLRASMDWSYELLSEAEQIMLGRLSVFAGGWMLEAAEAVCSEQSSVNSEQLPVNSQSLPTVHRTLFTEDVLDLLTHLVDKSLVVVEREQGTETRYRLLETIRQYAREKLVEAGGGEAVRQRHLTYYLNLAEQAEPELTGPNQVAWLKRLDDELDNLRAALEWALETDVEAGVRIAAVPWRFWEARGYTREQSGWLAQLLGRPMSSGAARAKALAAQADCLFEVGDLVQARALAEQGLELSRAESDRQAEALNLFYLGSVILVQGDVVSGRALLEESLALYQALGDKPGQADVLNILSLDHRNEAQAWAVLEECLRLYRELGHLAGVGSTLSRMAQQAYWSGDLSSPVNWLAEALAIQRQLGSKGGEAFILQHYGNVAFWRGDYEQARAYFEESIVLAEEVGRQVNGPWSQTFLAYTDLRQGDAARAREGFEDCLRQFHEAGVTIGVVFAIEGLASLFVTQGQFERAARLLAWADATRESLGEPRPAVEQADVDRDLNAIRAQLSETAFSAAQVEGRTMPVEGAIEVALAADASRN
jgi:predicted ATPase/DNA-binding SARP family transcriptional activator